MKQAYLFFILLILLSSCHKDNGSAIGSGSVVIIDGKKIEYNNIADIDFGMPISVENIIVHIMSKGDMYNLETRKFMGAEIAMNEP